MRSNYTSATSVFIFLTLAAWVYGLAPITHPHVITNPAFLVQPQVTTGSRLLKLGETMEFRLFLPAGVQPGEFKIFPRYLEQAEPGCDFNAAGDLRWLSQLPSVAIPLAFSNGQALITYQPAAAGSYLARWQVNGELFYRYFSVIEDDYIVIRYGGYPDLNQPTQHATGIPTDLPLHMENWQASDPIYQKFINCHRYYGDSIVPEFVQTPEMTHQQRVALYGANIAQAKALLPDINDAREGRVWWENAHPNDPGYVPAFAELGINSHFGLPMANAGPWLGMPEFPYFASPLDLRKMNQGQGGDVVCHQWDFCGGWHFLGPQVWHYNISNNNWELAGKYLLLGIKEFKNLAEMSGHPAFVCPLYDGPETVKFIDLFQRFMAFEIPKKFKLVYAKSIDMSDYYRRHYEVTPRTIFVSKTDDVFYDMHWHNFWASRHELAARARLPWTTRISSIMEKRTAVKDPMSFEYMLVEDQKRSIRFERRCPNPVWWFDYTKQEQEMTPQGSTISWVVTPNVDVICLKPFHDSPAHIPNLELVAAPEWKKENKSYKLQMKMQTTATFSDYAIAVWGLPEEFAKNPDPARVQTNAKEFLLAKNTDGEYHMVLFFDLAPDVLLDVTLRLP